MNSEAGYFITEIAESHIYYIKINSYIILCIIFRQITFKGIHPLKGDIHFHGIVTASEKHIDYGLYWRDTRHGYF